MDYELPFGVTAYERFFLKPDGSIAERMLMRQKLRYGEGGIRTHVHLHKTRFQVESIKLVKVLSDKVFIDYVIFVIAFWRTFRVH